MKTYRSMRGKVVELDRLRVRNETNIPVGNIKVNSQGDEMGPNGKIIKKIDDNANNYTRDDLIYHQPPAYNTTTADSTLKMGLKSMDHINPENVVSPVSVKPSNQLKQAKKPDDKEE